MVVVKYLVSLYLELEARFPVRVEHILGNSGQAEVEFKYQGSLDLGVKLKFQDNSVQTLVSLEVEVDQYPDNWVRAVVAVKHLGNMDRVVVEVIFLDKLGQAEVGTKSPGR